MKKYSVLLVDDEEDVVEAIVQKIDWDRLGYSLAGYAKNGLEALEIAEEKPIDVVLTDIKMPYMDGLTLSHRLKELYPSIKIIIFSALTSSSMPRPHAPSGIPWTVLPRPQASACIPQPPNGWLPWHTRTRQSRKK